MRLTTLWVKPVDDKLCALGGWEAFAVFDEYTEESNDEIRQLAEEEAKDTYGEDVQMKYIHIEVPHTGIHQILVDEPVLNGKIS